MKGHRPYRFAFVSNSSEIAATVKAFVDPRQEEMEVRLATMEDALPVARELLATGVEVVLGGGATGRLLRKTLDKPVVTIARTALDLLRAFMRAKRFCSDLVLTSFDAPTEGMDIFEKLLDVRISQLVFRTTAELAKGLERLVDEGVSCVLGSGICHEICSSLGIQAIVVYPGKEVILRAMEEARAIAAAQRKERGDAERLSAILQTISEGVLGIDTTGTLTLLNQAAAAKLSLDPAKVLGGPLPDSMRGMGLLSVLESGEPDLEQIRRIAGKDMVINTLPVLVDGKIQAVVSSFRLAASIQDIDRRLKEKLYAKGFVARYGLGHLTGESLPMRQLREQARRYANTDAAVLIQGETGTGKELLAQGIHNASIRKTKSFVAVNCSALPESLLESELFGYEEGAFTGAKCGGKAGLFELADEGSIFLDEIADISPGLQVRLLRVLEEREVMRLGGDRNIRVDVRVISASGLDLGEEVRRGRFRVDLYFRLAVLRLVIPPLRRHGLDIPPLLAELLRRCGLPERGIADLLTPKVREALTTYAWPGNVRELDSLARRFAALGGRAEAEDETLMLELLQEIQMAGFNVPRGQAASAAETDPVAVSTPDRLKDRVAAFEREVVRAALAACGNDRVEAAHRLGVSVNTLWRKLKD